MGIDGGGGGQGNPKKGGGNGRGPNRSSSIASFEDSELRMLVGSLGITPSGSAASVPEPSSAILLGFACLGLMLRRPR